MNPEIQGPLVKGKTRKQLKGKKDRADAKVARDVRAVVVERAQFGCARCGRYTGTFGHAHHRLPRSRGGRWTPENIEYLCMTCHGRAHQDGCKS